MKMHIVTDTNTRDLWLCRAHTSQDAIIKIAGRRGDRAHLSSVPLDRQNPMHRSLADAMTRGTDPDAELLAEWLRKLQSDAPQPKPRVNRVFCGMCGQSFATDSDWIVHSCVRKPRSRGGQAANPAEADALRKKAKNLRAKARRQEAAGDEAAAEATRAEVADLLRRAKGA